VSKITEVYILNTGVRLAAISALAEGMSEGLKAKIKDVAEALSSESKQIAEMVKSPEPYLGLDNLPDGTKSLVFCVAPQMAVGEIGGINASVTAYATQDQNEIEEDEAEELADGLSCVQTAEEVLDFVSYIPDPWEPGVDGVPYGDIVSALKPEVMEKVESGEILLLWGGSWGVGVEEIEPGGVYEFGFDEDS
jgi:hypothetical protein